MQGAKRLNNIPKYFKSYFYNINTQYVSNLVVSVK